MSNSENGKDCKKVLIFGLDNSGKTSILLSLQKDTNLLTFYKLKPTKGLSIQTFESVETDLSCWDFGGQEKYRIEYLQKFKKYVAKVSRLIYVVDIQDVKRYEASLDYLSKILEKLKENDIKPDISIYLHKYDPHIETLTGFEHINKIVKSELIPKIKDLIPSDITFDVYRTTIYTTFERTPELL